ncbi:TetR/AcrR family transcriptional regulator [Streptomyces sp. NPDC058001]|uniref:TetR/AcrR family transcriptional regulator n=1 Tax=Streptomyces sp. NPDC058001 TaxID=3346300 RepID=UPI0036E992C7
MTTPFQRARKPEHKEQRRHDILNAAATLGRRKGVRAVTLTDLAAEAGIHKSAVLRYFESREAVFLLLTADAWQDWAAALDEAVPYAAGPQKVAAALADTLADRPLFCDLLTHAQLTLERGVSEQEVRAFKITTLDAVDRVTDTLTTAMPWVSREQAIDLIAGVTAIAASLWQTANPPDTLARLYAEDPALAHTPIEFAPRLKRLAALLLAGTTTPTEGDPSQKHT